jgi:hypothetical protein
VIQHGAGANIKLDHSGRGTEGGNFYATQTLRLGRRFAETLVRATREGKVSYKEAYRFTGLYGRAFERYAKALGFGLSTT